MPPAMIVAPVIISGRAPMRATSCDAIPEAAMIMATIGRKAMPARSGL